ncbi:MAG: methyltransferase [Oscillospiraceae bacterium]|nr:methyltransferase [Oscillospiraceae bacterium]
MVFEYEQLGEHIKIAVSPEHKFGTDAFLLSDFAKVKKKDYAADLGTGCGIVAMLWFRPGVNGEDNGPKKAYCVDIQTQAIEQLKQTVEENSLHDRVVPMCMDLKNINSSLLPQELDVVTCNPPYKIEGTGILNDADPHTIARHEVMCTINDVCAAAAKMLKFGGRLCVCQRPERLADVLQAMRQNGIEPKRVRFVQKRHDSAPWLFLAEGKKGSKPYMNVEAPLVVQDEKGELTAEMKRIYMLYATK